MRVQYFIGMTALLCAAVACAPASAPKQNTGERIGAYIGSWAGYLPGEWQAGQSAPSTLSETRKGIQIWNAIYQGAVAVTSQMVLDDGQSTIIGDLFAKIPASGGDDDTSSGSASGGGLTTTPATGSGTVSTTPASGSGTLITAPSVGSGSAIVSTPAIGSGTSVSVNPAVFGAVYGAGGVAAVATASEFSSAFCGYLSSFISYMGRCGGADLSSISANCSVLFDAYLTEASAALASVPASVVQSVRCLGSNLESASCPATEGDLVTPLQAAYEACGITFEGDSI